MGQCLEMSPHSKSVLRPARVFVDSLWVQSKDMGVRLTGCRCEWFSVSTC